MLPGSPTSRLRDEKAIEDPRVWRGAAGAGAAEAAGGVSWHTWVSQGTHEVAQPLTAYPQGINNAQGTVICIPTVCCLRLMSLFHCGDTHNSVTYCQFGVAINPAVVWLGIGGIAVCVLRFSQCAKPTQAEEITD